MLIKLDENLGERGRQMLADAGHDAVTVADQGLSGAVDPHLGKTRGRESFLCSSFMPRIATVAPIVNKKTPVPLSTPVSVPEVGLARVTERDCGVSKCVARNCVAVVAYNHGKEEDHVGQAFQPDKPAPSGWKA
jgi:hypothetical protein